MSTNDGSLVVALLTTMNRTLTYLVFGFALLGISFAVGRWYEFGRSGHTFEVREAKDFESPLGTIHWSYVTDTVGVPFLDPGTTMIEFDNRIIYKARRTFQEGHPFADHIKVADKTIDWDDGDYRFHLTIDPMDKSTKGEKDALVLPSTAKGK